MSAVTGDTWIEYKAVKLSNLDGITARYAGKKRFGNQYKS